MLGVKINSINKEESEVVYNHLTKQGPKEPTLKLLKSISGIKTRKELVDISSDNRLLAYSRQSTKRLLNYIKGNNFTAATQISDTILRNPNVSKVSKQLAMAVIKIEKGEIEHALVICAFYFYNQYLSKGH